MGGTMRWVSPIVSVADFGGSVRSRFASAWWLRPRGLCELRALTTTPFFEKDGEFMVAA